VAESWALKISKSLTNCTIQLQELSRVTGEGYCIEVNKLSHLLGPNKVSAPSSSTWADLEPPQTSWIRSDVTCIIMCNI